MFVCFCTALETLYRYAESQSTPLAVEATGTDPLSRAFGLHSADFLRHVNEARAKWTAGGAREPRPKKLLYVQDAIILCAGVRSGILKREKKPGEWRVQGLRVRRPDFTRKAAGDD